jgi:hypothetical protein
LRLFADAAKLHAYSPAEEIGRKAFAVTNYFTLAAREMRRCRGED